MRRLGILGGMSWESSALYYRQLNEGVRARVGRWLRRRFCSSLPSSHPLQRHRPQESGMSWA